jgi:hypothetical protein
MKSARQWLAGAVAAWLVAAPALADDIYIYPAKGQSKEQQDKDRYECYEWAKQQTGFDPMKKPQATSAPPPEQDPQGGAVSGAAKGAAVGAIGGAIGGNAGKGAAIGALAGGVFGGARRRHQAAEQEAAQQQWADQQVANYQQQRSSWERAAKACLTGRGYTIQ